MPDKRRVNQALAVDFEDFSYCDFWEFVALVVRWVAICGVRSPVLKSIDLI